MNFNRKEYLKNIANETLDIINKGYYINNLNQKIDVRELIDKAIENSELIENENLIEQDNTSYLEKSNIKNITAINSATINTIIELRKKDIKGNIIALNFASAKNPGGGFLNGSSAQEESIARSSALYPCLLSQKKFYEFHKKQGSPLYSHKMIYSPDVPIFRDDNGKLLSEPILCSFITSPAVNAKVARDRGINENEIRKNMDIRINKILDLALNKKPSAIILGAFGCGVFGNNPRDVADIFASQLVRKVDKIKDTEIIFSIYDRNGEVVNIFSQEFRKYFRQQ
ncbi:MAG: TIGR02452 family protein [Bacillota bacterium]|nr:TIGR02452 family protein [Bacillota bacterium]